MWQTPYGMPLWQLWQLRNGTVSKYNFNPDKMPSKFIRRNAYFVEKAKFLVVLPVLRIRIRIRIHRIHRIHMFLGLPDPDPSIIMQKL